MDTHAAPVNRAKLDELRLVAADVLERNAEEVSDTGDFRKEYDADSMRAIEILSRIEKKYRIEIPQSELPAMRDLLAVYAIVARHAGWKD